MEVAQQLPGIVAGLEKKVVLEAVAPVFMELLTDPVEIVRREVCVLLRGVRSSAPATFCVLNAAIEANNDRIAELKSSADDEVEVVARVEPVERAAEPSAHQEAEVQETEAQENPPQE